MARDISGERKYFAAANSGTGFQSYYKHIFDSSKFSSLIIVKGGSGTGKSSFIRKLAREGERKGGEAEYFYCSSDASSLDGLILALPDGRRIAALDGTAPHLRDTELPGCCDVIHDTGKYWDGEALAVRRGEIEKLTRERKDAFSDVYNHLSAALAGERIADRITEK
ncbi:MAG: ATPase, partial [Clostridia bacterium]|nr:ATPase [Clostridia bacterium]